MNLKGTAWSRTKCIERGSELKILKILILDKNIQNLNYRTNRQKSSWSLYKSRLKQARPFARWSS